MNNYKIGDIIIIKTQSSTISAMIVSSDTQKVSLIDLSDGMKWSGPISVNSCWSIPEGIIRSMAKYEFRRLKRPRLKIFDGVKKENELEKVDA